MTRSALELAFSQHGHGIGSSGSVISSDMYDAFGNGTSTGAADVYGYNGKSAYYNDTETGLKLLGHRFYDSATGRFINRDPSGYGGGINLYNYVDNSAASFTDPDGFLKLRSNAINWNKIRGMGARFDAVLRIVMTAKKYCTVTHDESQGISCTSLILNASHYCKTHGDPNELPDDGGNKPPGDYNGPHRNIACIAARLKASGLPGIDKCLRDLYKLGLGHYGLP